MPTIKYKGKFYTEKEYKKKKSEESGGALAVAAAVVFFTFVFLNLPGMALFASIMDTDDHTDTRTLWVGSVIVSLLAFLIVRLTSKTWKRVHLDTQCFVHSLA